MPLIVIKGDAVYAKKRPALGKGLVEEVVHENHRLCKSYRVRWEDGSLTRELGKDLRVTPHGSKPGAYFRNGKVGSGGL